MVAMTLRLGPADREALASGAEALGVALESSDLDRLAEFAALLDTWSAKTNLISCRDARELVDRHFLDSLALVLHIEQHGGIVDLGSGAGFPGVPLAVVRTDQRVVLVEARRRRANFLRTVKRELGLRHLDVLEQRAESEAIVSSAGIRGQTRSAVSRAVWSDGEIYKISARWIGAGGRLYWMRSDRDCPEPPGGEFEKAGVEEYRVGAAPPRAIHIFERC